MFPHFRHKLLQRYHSLLPAEAVPLSAQPREPVVLCAGTIGGRKGQTTLAEAFARIAHRHPQWRLDFVGRTELSQDAERIRVCAAQHGLADRICLLGAMSHEQTLARMSRASIFAIPSLQEGLGLALQEALYCGCVGVGSRVGGIPELLDEENNGLMAAPGDVAGLSAALDRLMSNPPLLEKLRAESRPSILRKGMTVEAMVESYRDLYERCFSTPNASQQPP